MNNNNGNHYNPNYQAPPHLGRNFPPRTSAGPPFSRSRPPPVPAPPRPRPEDAQPSESVMSNRRPVAPPPVVPTSAQSTYAGGWGGTPHGNAGMSANTWSARNHNGNQAMAGGSRWNENSAGQYPGRPRPQTTAGGWSTSSAANGTLAGKGKERQWGVASSTNSTNYPPTPVAVPVNPRPKIWISQLPPSVTQEEIRTVFSPFGEIEKITVNQSPRSSYAYAHVTYTTVSSATDAITALNYQPFPSINGIGSSRAIRVSYASPPRNQAEGGGPEAARSLLVTTEPPTAETPSETENRLFRARDTPEYSQSQGVKKENESPVKRLPLVAEETVDTNRRSRSTSSRYATPDSVDGSTISSRRRTSASPQPRGQYRTDQSTRTPFPSFINPPELSLGSITFPATRLGTLESTSTASTDSAANLRRYSLSYYFSNRLVSISEGLESSQDLSKWVSCAVAGTGYADTNYLVERSSLRLTRPGPGQVEGVEKDAGEILTFIIVVSKKVLRELGRDHPWTQDEEEANRSSLSETKREISKRLSEMENSQTTETTLQVSTHRYIEPPSLSFNQLPLPPSRVGILDPSYDSATYSLRYIYPLDIFSLCPTTSSPSITAAASSSSTFHPADLEARIRNRLQASGMSMISLKFESDESPEADDLSTEDGEGVLSLEIDFISSSLIGIHAREERWNEVERRKIETVLENTRKIAREKREAVGVRTGQEGQERGQERGGTSQAKSSQEGPQPDGTIIERIPLPAALVGAGPDQSRRQTLFRVEEVKKMSSRGNVVLSSSVVGNFISINYFVDDSAEPPALHPTGAVPSGSRQSLSISQQFLSRREDDIAMAEGDDVKPVIENDGEQDMEIDQLDSATPEPRLSSAVKFPLGILRNNRADSVDTYQACTTFIHEYFRRFDSSRSSLEGLYARNAFFSFKVDPTPPRRISSPVTLFSREWFNIANRFASTAIPITNLIRRLPACSHDTTTILFNARTIPELHIKKRDRPPILLHLTGEFEEFPIKAIRRFDRTFVLVPNLGGAEGSGGYLVHSDQLLIGHKAAGEPRDLEVTDPPFRPSSGGSNPKAPSRAPPVVQPHSSSTAQTMSTTTAFSPPPSHHDAPQPSTENQRNPQPQPVASTSTAPVPPPSRTSEKRPRPSTSTTELASSRPTATSTSPMQNASTLPAAMNRRLSQGEVLELSDSESAVSHLLLSEPPIAQADEESDSTPSMSPEVTRPAKRPHLGNGVSERRSPESARNERDLSAASSVSNSAPVSTSTARREPPARPPLPTTTSQSRRSSNTLGKRKANEETVSTPASASKEVESAARTTQSLPEEIQRFIAEQVAKEVQEKLKNAGNVGAEPAAKKKSTKGKEKEDVQVPQKKKKVKEKKDKFANGLGTGLSPGDSRIVIAGQGHSILHGFDGRSNKLRGMIQTADAASFLSVSFLGDIAEWSMQPLNSMTKSSITKLYSSNQDKYRVDDFTYNQAKDTLLVGYLGAKEGKEMACPPNQVILYKRDTTGGETKLVETRLTDAPHVNGGVTAIMALPNKASTGRLRFVTGGEDKKVYLWTRQRSTQEVKLEKFVTEHTSMITSFAFLDTRNELVSAGKDRRVVTYDLERKQATWQTALSTAVMSVSSVLCDPNLIMSRLATPSDQFLIHDRRVAATSPPVVTFGYDLPPHRSTNGTLLPTNMGRYPRGDQMDTVVAFPDHDQGVKLWDLRQIRSGSGSGIVKKQDLAGLGRSKVVQASFKGRNELCLMELAHFTRLSIKG